MELKLVTYKTENRKKIVDKTFCVSEYELSFGTIENFIKAIDIENLTKCQTEDDLLKWAGKAVLQGFDQIEPLILDVFEGLTAEQLKTAKTKDVAKVLIDVMKYTFAEIMSLGKEKN